MVEMPVGKQWLLSRQKKKKNNDFYESRTWPSNGRDNRSMLIDQEVVINSGAETHIFNQENFKELKSFFLFFRIELYIIFYELLDEWMRFITSSHLLTYIIFVKNSFGWIILFI